MYHVGVATHSWYVKGVNINLSKEWGRHCDYRWNVNLMEMSGLIDVARICEPFDIHTYVYVATRNILLNGNRWQMYHSDLPE